MDLKPLRRLRWLVLLPPLVGFLVTMRAGWPGAISPDAANSIMEGSNFYFSGQQPPMYGFFWTIAQALFPRPIAIEIIFVMQAFAFWFAFVLLAYASLRDRSPLMAVVASIAGFLPPLLDLSVMVESNMQAGIAWTLAIALAYAFRKRRTLLACLPLIFYGFIARSGMIVAVGPILFACVLLNQPGIPRTRASLYAVVGMATFFAISWTVTTFVLGAPTREHTIAISELFDIAGVYEKTGTHCIPASLVPKTTTAEALLTEYDPGNVSWMIWASTKGGFILPESQRDYASLRQCWLETMQRYPKEFLEVKARFVRLFLMIGVNWAPATEPDFSWNANFGLSVPQNGLRTAIHDYVQRTSESVVWKGWFWFSLAGLVSILSLALSGERAHAGLAVYVGALGSLLPHLLLGQAALSRYYFLPYILCVVSILILGGPLLDAVRTRMFRVEPVSRQAAP